MKRFVYFALATLILMLASAAAPVLAQFTVADLMKVHRVGDPQISPDGKWVAHTVGDVNFDANRTVTQIYLVSIDGGEAKRLTNGDRSSSSPRWSPDGKRIAFISSRDGSSQVFTMNTQGESIKRITSISTEAGNPVWSPNGNWIAFVSDVYPDCADDACNKRKDEAADASKVKAHVTDRLLYRHWVEWRDRKRTHVFVVDSDGGTARDMTPGDHDSPPYAASGPSDFSFSPDSKELAYLRNPDRIEAISTNSDVYIVPVSGDPSRDAVNITASNRGYDVSPTYSPDGRYIGYRSQATEGFEADRWRMMVYDRQAKTSREVARGFDLQVEDFVFSNDSQTIYLTAMDHGYAPVFKVATSGGAVSKVVSPGFAGDLRVNGTTLIFSNSSASRPSEIYVANTDGSGLKPLTRTNDGYMRPFNLRAAENMEWTGAMNTKIQGFLFKPANFDAGKKYPVIVLIHGGPQSAFNDSWGYRWNPQIFASQGYIVFMPNPRGSTGFGQKFTNDITADWGGKAYTDIMNGVAMVTKLPFVDKTRIGGAGASYGGYMVDWILGHNTDPRAKFTALVSHAGVYNLESMAGSTEELWFVNWEFKGFPWNSPAQYNRWSPNKFAANFKTPTLVTCGELDFRVPYDQSLQLYTALQLNHTDSKLIIFPDEGHWILKPQNSEFWYRNVLEWFAKYLRP
ncbi:MAG: S9 family peptidase [Pyrinomonadaceae bacterium]